jgi:caa(3)-type oxidase subunit IV
VSKHAEHAHAPAHGGDDPKPTTPIYRQGYIVFAVLMILTLVEYVLGLEEFNGQFTMFLVLIAILKAGLIINYFMHVARLWQGEGGH